MNNQVNNKIKILIIGFLVSTIFLNANNAKMASKNVISYMDQQLARNPNLVLDKVVLKKTKKITANWKAYILSVKAKFKGKNIEFSEVLFSNGNLVSREFIDIKTGVNVKDNLFSFEKKYYNKNNLISGSSKSKHKVVVFSDPMCPYCTALLPSLITFANKNPKLIALYYYHFPLTSIHPTAPIASKAMIVAHNRNIKDYALKIYSHKIDSRLSDTETLNQVNLALNLKGKKKITKKDINKANILKHHDKDIAIANELLLNGTPVVFINGMKDNTRDGYKRLAK